MPELKENEVPKRARDLFNKGFAALERGNLDYAIDLLIDCVEIEPSFLTARKYLRAAEIQKMKQKKAGFFASKMSAIGGMPQYLNVMTMIKQGKASQALVSAEKLLKADPVNAKFVHAFAQAADLAGLPEAAIQTLEIARDHNVDDADILDYLGDMYAKTGDTEKAKSCYDRVCALKPNDPAANKKLKDSLAMNSISRDGWQQTAKDGGTFRQMIKDTDEATIIEKQSKAVKTDDDADTLIADTIAKIEAEPKNINYYRALARLYTQRKMFDQAVDTLQKAIDMSPGDPELDNTLADTRVKKLEFEIDNLREAGDNETADAKELEKAQFVFDDLQHRVQRYPNDLALRYTLGVMLYENDYINEAIQQFQLSQKNPKQRVKSLYYLAMCFKSKKQYDMAVQQLESAGEELISMDANKKENLYQLGVIYELMGNREKAAACFKQIYAVDIGYRDVAEKVEKAYSK